MEGKMAKQQKLKKSYYEYETSTGQVKQVPVEFVDDVSTYFEKLGVKSWKLVLDNRKK